VRGLRLGQRGLGLHRAGKRQHRTRRERHARRERGEDRRLLDGAGGARGRGRGLERRPQALDRAGVQLRHARLVYAQLVADLLHRDVTEVVEAHQAPLAGRQRRHRVANALLDLGPLVGGVGGIGLGGHERRGQRRLVDAVEVRQRGRGLDRVDPDDGAAQALLVGADLGRQIRQRRLVAQLAAQRLARGLELAALAAHASRPRLAPERVDHRPAHAPLGEGLELDAAPLVEPMGGIDEAHDPVLHQVPDVDRVRHRRREAARESLDKREAGDNAVAFV